MQKKFFLILFYLNFCYGGLSIHPVVSSFLLPGSGERNLGYNESSMFFMQSEILLFTSCLLTFKASFIEYMAYAGEHALTTLAVTVLGRYCSTIQIMILIMSI